MSDGQRQTGERTINRRAMLAGVAGGALGVAGLGARRAAATSYGDVVDVVDAGADPDGNEPIGDVLDEYADDDTLLWFPPGEYLMEEQFRFTGYDKFGIAGDDATIVPGTVEEMDGQTAVEGTFSGPTRLFRLGTSYDPGDGLHFEGLDFDFTDDQSGFRAIEAYVTDYMHVRDIDILGQHDIGSFGPALFSVTEPDGISTVEGFRAPDGGEYSENTIGSIDSGPTGILIPQSHKGKLWVRECELGGFPDNGLYTSCPDGRVVVEGGTYRNSNVANIRLSGDYSYVKDATVVVDENRPEDGNQRGIRLDTGEHLWVYDTDVRLEEPNGYAITVMSEVDSARIQESSVFVGDATNDAIVVREGAGPTDVYTTDIEVTGAGHALHIEPDGGIVDCLELRITGDASGENGRNAILCERDNTILRHLVVKQPGPDYRRALQISAYDCYVYSGYYGASHIPIVEDGDDTLIEDVTAQSYDGYEALKLTDASNEPDVVSNRLYNGIWDHGATDPYVQDNSYPDA